jgi:hypothetical protein
MKKIFYSHPDTIIAILVLIFLGTLVAFYSWASNDIYTEVHQALTFSPSQTVDTFNLSGAAALDLRGLLNNSPSAPVVVPSAPATTTRSSTPNRP